MHCNLANNTENVFFTLEVVGSKLNKLKTKVGYLQTCYLSWRSDYCYLNEGESNLNQSKDDPFVKRVAKNNN